MWRQICRNMKGLFLIPVLVAAVDQWIKHLVRMMPDGRPFYCIPGWFDLVPSVNTGAAFSIFRGNNLLLILFSAMLLLICLYIGRTIPLTKPAEKACMFLIGGGLGNLIDRVLFGGVTDYIRLLFIEFPIFNFADIVITCSVFVLIFLMITNRFEESTGKTHE